MTKVESILTTSYILLMTACQAQKLSNEKISLNPLMEYSVVNSDFDFNSDGIKDLALKAVPMNLEDGAEINLEIHQLNEEGYSNFVYVFKNIYPLWYRRYGFEYIATLSSEKQSNYPYMGEYPLKSLQIKGDSILISIVTGVLEGVDLTYSFNQKKSDWYLIEENHWTSNLLGDKKIDYQCVNGESLKAFDYIKHM